jgi:hypothetical protein
VYCVREFMQPCASACRVQIYQQMQAEADVGFALKNKIVPNAVHWFTGEVRARDLVSLERPTHTFCCFCLQAKDDDDEEEDDDDYDGEGAQTLVSIFPLDCCSMLCSSHHLMCAICVQMMMRRGRTNKMTMKMTRSPRTSLPRKVARRAERRRAPRRVQMWQTLRLRLLTEVTQSCSDCGSVYGSYLTCARSRVSRPIP